MQEFGEVDDVKLEDAGFLKCVAVLSEKILHEGILRRGPDVTGGTVVREVVFFEVGEEGLRDGGSAAIWDGPDFGAEADPFVEDGGPTEDLAVGFGNLEGVGFFGEVLGAEFTPGF